MRPMRTLAIVATLALLAASPARAEWQSLRGKEAPDFKVAKWLNACEGDSVADLRGKLLLVEFWATW